MLTETERPHGSDMRPWPWAVNMEGEGHWFASEAGAKGYAEEHFKRGARSFDVGCFQINYKWHHQNFASLDAMFDPVENALYAARFLATLYRETSDWGAAAGRYHSRTPEHAVPYQARFERFRARYLAEDRTALPDLLANLGAGAAAPMAPDARERPQRTNSFPLLLNGGARGMGSLVPISGGRNARSLFAPDEAG
ncbi:hypothetical protein GCM10011358_04180 [Sinisalibacter lacisalsi]|uniref:Transglycosylase SLT domain-containing protein n=2 Tax=Sinisalibacter lacisalsi TaxID=1526570 RepID=A0ABQ1QC94_9RHOB|nr:hypothetical protein GCM10011358_04180 [Sinisalibacter lacisalsi]